MRTAINQWLDFIEKGEKPYFNIYKDGRTLYATQDLEDFVKHCKLLTYDEILVTPF